MHIQIGVQVGPKKWIGFLIRVSSRKKKQLANLLQTNRTTNNTAATQNITASENVKKKEKETRMGNVLLGICTETWSYARCSEDSARGENTGNYKGTHSFA
mmetsp:Transcript_6502/g.10010  ORF Transcript_6502/g.10010 Transcript_6502/m.10010 type:complete len:101 (-) Transcript_6502:1330-1632(-)